MKDDLTSEVISEMVRGMPERATGDKIVELFVCILDAYRMRDQWVPVFFGITAILEQIELAERECEEATKH